MRRWVSWLLDGGWLHIAWDVPLTRPHHGCPHRTFSEATRRWVDR